MVLCLMQVSVRLMQSERFTLMVSAVVNIAAGSVMSRGLEGMKQEYRSSLSFFFFPSCSCTGRCLSRKKVCGSETVTIYVGLLSVIINRVRQVWWDMGCSVRHPDIL